MKLAYVRGRPICCGKTGLNELRTILRLGNVVFSAVHSLFIYKFDVITSE